MTLMRMKNMLLNLMEDFGTWNFKKLMGLQELLVVLFRTTTFVRIEKNILNMENTF